MSSLENHFSTNLPGIKSNIFSSLVTDGYYARRPDSVRSTYLAAGVVIGFLLILGGLKIASSQGMAPLTFAIAGALTGAIICGFGWFMPAHTEQGARALEGVLAFEDFVGAGDVAAAASADSRMR